MSIFSLSNLLYEKWKDILLLWEQGKILDGYGKLNSKPQLVEKSTFNCLVGLKESHGEACTWFEGAQIFLQYQHVTRGNSHLLMMLEFYYNIKKWR
jgi:hypothetical protein